MLNATLEMACEWPFIFVTTSFLFMSHIFTTHELPPLTMYLQNKRGEKEGQRLVPARVYEYNVTMEEGRSLFQMLNGEINIYGTRGWEGRRGGWLYGEQRRNGSYSYFDVGANATALTVSC